MSFSFKNNIFKKLIVDAVPHLNPKNIFATIFQKDAEDRG